MSPIARVLCTEHDIKNGVGQLIFVQSIEALSEQSFAESEYKISRWRIDRLVD